MPISIFGTFGREIEEQYLYVIGLRERLEIINNEGERSTHGPMDGPFKIGISKNPSKRLNHYQTHNWLELKVMLVHRCDPENIKLIENDLKKGLNQRRYWMSGEWYDCSKQEIFYEISNVFRTYDEIGVTRYPTMQEEDIHEIIKFPDEEIVTPTFNGEYTGDYNYEAFLDMWDEYLVFIISRFNENFETQYCWFQFVDERVEPAMAEMGIRGVPDRFTDVNVAEETLEQIFRKIAFHPSFRGRI